MDQTPSQIASKMGADDELVVEDIIHDQQRLPRVGDRVVEIKPQETGHVTIVFASGRNVTVIAR